MRALWCCSDNTTGGALHTKPRVWHKESVSSSA
jgi:hypothetical protein